jgi:hypothetical protein
LCSGIVEFSFGIDSLLLVEEHANKNGVIKRGNKCFMKEPPIKLKGALLGFLPKKFLKC